MDNLAPTVSDDIGRWHLALILGIIGVVFIVALGLLYAVFTETISGAEATATATVMLVLITAVYASVTYQMMLETRMSREQEIMPIIEFQTEEFRPKLINTGRGPARKLDVTLSLEPAGEKHQLIRQTLPPNEAIAITVPPFTAMGDRTFEDIQLNSDELNVEDFEDEIPWNEIDEFPYESLVLDWTCKDAWGNSVEQTERYDVWDLTEAQRGEEPLV